MGQRIRSASVRAAVLAFAIVDARERLACSDVGGVGGLEAEGGSSGSEGARSLSLARRIWAMDL